MWKNTKITQQLNIALPIIQGPFGGGASSVDLVVAVSEAGGLGFYGANHLSALQIKEVAKEINNRQAEGLIAGSIVIWNELKNQLKSI